MTPKKGPEFNFDTLERLFRAEPENMPSETEMLNIVENPKLLSQKGNLGRQILFLAKMIAYVQNHPKFKERIQKVLDSHCF